QTGEARFSLPEARWQTVKSQDEWKSRFKKKLVDPNQPDLSPQEQPMDNEELSSFLHEIESIKLAAQVAQNPADAQKAVTQLNDVQGQNDLPVTNDAAIRKTASMLMKERNINPEEAVQLAISVEAQRTANKLQAKQTAETTQPSMTPN